MSEEESRGRVWIKMLGRTLNMTRLVVLNMVFIAVVIAACVMLMSKEKVHVPDQAALVVAPNGVIVEQLSGDPLDRAVADLRGDNEPETLLRDLVDAIRIATEDDRIAVLVLDLSRMSGAGLSKLQDLGAAIDGFREAGKTVLATADVYGQSSYYLAARADEVYLHHMGMLIIEGYGRFRTYYKDGIDRLGVDVNVFRVGEFKSAVEPYLRNGMSDEAREANLEWLGDLWRAWVDDVAAARGMEAGEIVDYAEHFGDYLEEAGGQAAQAARDAGLVDVVATRDQVKDRLIELVGEDEDDHMYSRVGFASYLEDVADRRPGAGSEDDGVVAVVVARGTILDGSQPPGAIGGDSTAALVRRARNDPAVKALVLRVDSGGGSGFASEVIRRELEITRQAGKPVVSSMGSVAASGGYWITMASDQVWASPSTITGSIGVFGMFPTFQKPLAKYLGMRVDGVGTTQLAGALRLDRALREEVGEMIQAMIDEFYRDFIARVAEARGLTVEDVDEIARGRVWSGADAHELGLVDSMGGMDEAVKAAARLAELGEDYSVRYFERELGFKERLLADLLAGVSAWGGDGVRGAARGGALREMVQSLEEQAQALARLNDPNGVYAYCPVEVD